MADQCPLSVHLHPSQEGRREDPALRTPRKGRGLGRGEEAGDEIAQALWGQQEGKEARTQEKM